MRAVIPVTIHRRGGPVLDENDEQVYDEWGTPMYSEDEDIETRAIRVAPVRATEYSIGQQVVTISAAAAFTPDEDVKATDEMTAYVDAPRRYRVVGAFPVPCRDGRIKYVRCDLESVEQGVES